MFLYKSKYIYSQFIYVWSKYRLSSSSSIRRGSEYGPPSCSRSSADREKPLQSWFWRFTICGQQCFACPTEATGSDHNSGVYAQTSGPYGLSIKRHTPGSTGHSGNPAETGCPAAPAPGGLAAAGTDGDGLPASTAADYLSSGSAAPA